MPTDTVTTVFNLINIVLLVGMVVGVPVAIIYVISLLRRIARNTARDSE